MAWFTLEKVVYVVTYIGCIKKGFDFLGVHFDAVPTIAKASLEKHRAKLAQRYAQGASHACLGDYVKRWTSWCKSVMATCVNSDLITQPSLGVSTCSANMLLGGPLKEYRYEAAGVDDIINLRGTTVCPCPTQYR